MTMLTQKAFSWRKSFKFWKDFQLSLFYSFSVMMNMHWSRQWLDAHSTPIHYYYKDDNTEHPQKTLLYENMIITCLLMKYLSSYLRTNVQQAKVVLIYKDLPHQDVVDSYNLPKSISWLLMSCWHKKWAHQQPWYYPSIMGISQPQHQNG